MRPALRLDQGPISAEFLLGYFDLAIAGALDYGRYQGVYLGPWWEVPTDAEGEVRGWKRAVLRRRPTGGAVHWGHLFLLCVERLTEVELSGETLGRLSIGPRERVDEIVLRDGAPRLLLLLRPTYPERRTDLFAFGDDVAERFRRQLD